MIIARRSGEEGLLHPLLFEGPLGLFHQLGGEEEYQGRGRAGLKIIKVEIRSKAGKRLFTRTTRNRI